MTYKSVLGEGYICGMKFSSPEEAHNHGVAGVGKTAKELMSSATKGNIAHKSKMGDAWEAWFGVTKNSEAQPDLVDAKVELKATPIKKTRNGYSAKERLVLNMINYEIEGRISGFQSSSFYQKNRYLEIGFYLPSDDVSWEYWKIVKAALLQIDSLKDINIIKKDWELIHSYIKDGKAHELSEGLTNYLGACTKGANKNALRRQCVENAPLAPQRAYSLKTKYMTYILRENIFGNNIDAGIRVNPYSDVESTTQQQKNIPLPDAIINEPNELRNKTLEQVIIEKLKPYYGKTTQELSNIFHVNSTAKQLNHLLISRMLGVTDVSKTEEFSKANITVKTIQLNEAGHNKEHVSFPAFKSRELINEKWETSTLRDLLDSSKFFFAVFQTSENENYFRGVKFWNMPIKDIEGTVRDAWETVKQTFQNGVELHYRGGKVRNNLLKARADCIIHVRPHSARSSYALGDPNADELPTPAKWTDKPPNFSDSAITKQCFWLNNDYVLKQLSGLIDNNNRKN